MVVMIRELDLYLDVLDRISNLWIVQRKYLTISRDYAFIRWAWPALGTYTDQFQVRMR